MSHYVIRLWLPDRPGTLGRVAAAIGSAQADVVGIEILERGAGMAIDEVTVSLPEGRSPDDVVAALSSVEGVAVEDLHEIDADRPDHGVMALAVVAAVLESGPESRWRTLCDEASELLEADWLAVVDLATSVVQAAHGTIPDTAWLVAFLAGTSHLPTD
jgi:UTP:GlnB (protein PII) uridylyltransferase